MARLREFDKEELLDKAIEAFWRNGYGGTSIQVLEESTGVKRGSLYNAFGDKATLFSEAYDRYVQTRSLGSRIRADSSRSPRDVLFELLDVVVAETACHRRGCLITNSVAEVGSFEPDFAERMRKGLVKLEGLITDLAERAVAAGELSSDLKPRQLARFLIVIINGMRVLSKLDLDEEFLVDAARQAKSVLSGQDKEIKSGLVRLFDRLSKTKTQSV